MSDSKITKREQFKESGFPKENKSYGSIQEYISDLKTVFTISSSEKSNEEEFLDFLDIVDYVIKIEKIEFNYNDINCLETFLNELFLITNGNTNKYSKIGNYYYDSEKEILSCHDREINFIQGTIFNLHIEPFYNLKNKINKTLWNHIAILISEEEKRLEETEFCNNISNMLKTDFEEQLHLYNDPKYLSKNIDEYEEERKEAHKSLELINNFIKYLDEFSKIKTKPVQLEKLSKEEKELFKISNSISNFNYENGMYFMDDLDLESDYFEKYIDDETDDLIDLDLGYMQSEICEKIYSGQYFLSMNDDDDIEKMYLQWINDAGGNGYWPMHLSNEFIYTKKKRKGKHIRIRKKMINHYENFFSFNELVEKLNNEKNI